MKNIVYIILFFFTFGNSQDVVRNFIVDCSANSIITENQDLIVKQLCFESEMLPMSYNTRLVVYDVSGQGIIVSPSTVTSRRPKDGENEPKVIVMGCKSDFENLFIGKFVKVIYVCYD